MVLFIGFINGSVLLLSLVDSSMKQDTWLVIISGYIVSVPFILTYIFLSKKFPGKNLTEINDIIFGKALGKIISICYIIFFILLFSYNYRQIVEFYSGYILSDTPQIILYITIALLCAYAVKKGIAAIAKVSMYTVAFAVFVVMLTFILLIGNMDFSNFMPVFEATPEDFIHSTYTMACIPYCEVICFLMVMPYLSSGKKLGRYAIAGTGIAMLFFLVIIIQVTTTLGPSSAIFSEGSFQSVRLIDIGEFLTRMELLVALGITASMFIKISVFKFAAVKSVSHLLRMKTYTPLLLPMAAIGIVTALIAYGSTIENAENANYHIVFALPFEFIIPPLSLLVAKIRKLPKKAGESVP